MMTISDRALLERNKLFRDISFESIEHLLKDCQVVTLKAGETLLEAGQKNTSLYLVLDGELRVYLNGQDFPVHAVLGTGECVGEISLIDSGKTSALVMVARDARLLVVPHEVVWSLVERSNAIARNLLEILTGRIRNNNLLQVTTTTSSLEFDVADNLDTLTGLHNKNWMGEAFHRMGVRCERSGVPLFLLLADIDRFKDFNDRHGHLAGDSLLKGVARILAVNLRPQDLLIYMGGDKFAVLLQVRSQNLAMQMAERLRVAVAAPALHIAGGSTSKDTRVTQEEHVTLSLGVSVAQPGDTLDSVLAAAEGALLKAKTDGRNQAGMATVNA